MQSSFKNFKERLSGKKQIDAEYWRKIFWSKKEAKKALLNLMIPTENRKLSKVLEVTLENGNTIPVEQVTEEQAHEFMKALCPSWAFPKPDNPSTQEGE